MAAYDSSDLKSVLAYIKDRFGLDVFTKPGRVPALLSDLAPDMKNERNMLEKLFRLGILIDFAENTYEEEPVQKRIISKSLNQLTQAEFIRPAIAASYISILAEVFGWKIEVEIPKETAEEKIEFDSERYMKESQDRDFLLGKKAFNEERFDDARLLFSKAHGNGNVLAGVHLGEIYYYGNGCDRNYDKAIPLLVDGMHRGCPLGAELLAKAYRAGKGVPEDVAKAKEIHNACVEALESMCASGCADAQYMLGFDLLYGIFSAENKAKAYYWLEKARKSGHVGAGVQVAKILINGWGQEKDEKAGITILDSYAGTTNTNAHFELGKIYYFGGLKEQDYKEALYHFRKAAEGGHAGSQEYVGHIYYFGEGVPVDRSEARKWYELSESQGNKDSSRQLGLIYYYGNEVSVDRDKAFKYFKYSADKGDAAAQYMLINYYLRDDEYKNYALGRQYLEKSAEQGFVSAQTLLAGCYHVGAYDYVKEDEKFVYWMRKAADQDDPAAQRMLGEAYINLGNEKALPKSYPDAIEWMKKACKNGDIEAAVHLARIYLTIDGYKDASKFTYYVEQAERLLDEEERNGNIFGDEHESLAELYFISTSDENASQKAFDHYCKAVLTLRDSSLFILGWMYFIKGYTSEFLRLSPEELIQEIIIVEKDSESYKLAYLLGNVYDFGIKVHANKAAAEKWYLKAIEKGSLPAAYLLGDYYVNERQMYDKGFSLLEKAYAGGVTEAARLLGLCYKNGLGVKKNLSKAKALLKEASEKGDEDAAAELKKIIF
ncbi:MAG: hypothetical protein K5989_08575 [Lachnospiraceae bacterium]|nr:hypothetical protein [Lachnospiraceae bacterium]